MKKYLSVVACLLVAFALTGCGKESKVECTLTDDQGRDLKVIGNLGKDNKITSTTMIMEVGTEIDDATCTMVEAMLGSEVEDVKCSGDKVTAKLTSKELVGMTKDEFIKEFEGYTCK